MNKQSRQRRKIAAKNFKNGQRETSFDVCSTMPNSSSLGWRKQTITIGDLKRKSKFPKVARKGFTQGETKPE